MLIVKLKPFKGVEGLDEGIEGLVHKATTWQIATDIDFKHIVESKKSSKYLNVYESDIVIPEGLVYYVRAKRHFNESNADYYTTPAKVIANNSEITNMVLDTEIVVDEPIIYVEDEELANRQKTSFRVRTSKFRSSADGHKSTHWFVRTSAGDLLFHKLDDEEHKTEITIDKTPEMCVESELIISAIHVGASGVESKIGTKVVRCTGYQYFIHTPLTEVQPYTDLRIKFGSKREDGQTKIIKVSLIDVSDGSVIQESTLGRSNTFTVEWDKIKFNSSYYLDVHCYDNNGVFGVSRHLITTRRGFIAPIENVNINYENTLERIENKLDFTYSGAVSTMETPFGYIPYPKDNDLNLYQYVVDPETGLLKSTTTPLNGVSLVTPNPAYLNIRYTADDILLIDTLETDVEGNTYPVFMVYSYLRNRETYILTSKIKRKDERYTTGYINNLVQHSSTDFYYIPAGKAEIRRLDLKNNYVTRVISLPSEGLGTGNLVWLPSKKLLVIGQDTYTSIYDIEKKTFLSSLAVPEGFRGVGRRQLLLPNGDTLMWKTTDDPEDKGTAVLKFDYKSKRFMELGETFPYRFIPKSSCLLIDNRVILTDYVNEDELVTLEHSANVNSTGVYGYIFK